MKLLNILWEWVGVLILFYFFYFSFETTEDLTDLFLSAASFVLLYFEKKGETQAAIKMTKVVSFCICTLIIHKIALPLAVKSVV